MECIDNGQLFRLARRGNDLCGRDRLRRDNAGWHGAYVCDPLRCRAELERNHMLRDPLGNIVEQWDVELDHDRLHQRCHRAKQHRRPKRIVRRGLAILRGPILRDAKRGWLYRLVSASLKRAECDLQQRSGYWKFRHRRSLLLDLYGVRQYQRLVAAL